MTALETRMILLEESNTTRHQETDDVIEYEEYDLPIQNMQTLKRMEELLQNNSFADKMLQM